MRRARILAPTAAVLAVLLSLTAAAFSGPAGAAPGEDIAPIANPDLQRGCGIDIHVILDESGSIDSANATDDVQRAFRAFTSALANTGSRMAVSEFSTVARLPLLGSARNNYTAVTNSTIDDIFNPYITNNYRPSGSTHWEDAFRIGRYFLPRPSQATPHLVVFITDGDPNEIVREDRVTYNPGNPNVAQNEYELKVPLEADNETANSNENPAKDRAVPNANALKADGSHILTVAVGSGLTSASSLARIVAVSGANVWPAPPPAPPAPFDITTDDVFRVPDFDELEDALRDAAFSLCAPSVNVRKLVDANPDPAVDDFQPAQGWEMTASVAPAPLSWVLPAGASGPSATSSTGPDGFVNFQWTTAASVSSTITVTEVVQPGFTNDPSQTACTYRTPEVPSDRPLPGFSATTGGFTGTVPFRAIVTCRMVNRIPPAPAIDIEKNTNGIDADTPTGPFVPVGSTVTWTYRVTNTGNVPLTDVRVTDSDIGAITCPGGALQPAGIRLCTATGTATAGQYANTGVVRGTGADQVVIDTDPSHYFGVEPGIDIEKATNGADADAQPGPLIPVGDDVDWTYVVTNTGNSVLTGIVVTDDQGVTVTCPSTTLPPAPGPNNSMTCTATGTAEPGQYANVGSVTGTTPTGGVVRDSDGSHYFGEDPSVEIQKLTNLVDADAPPGPQIAVGGRVLWSYVVTNTGNVALRAWSVTDDQAPFTLCPRIGLIAPGQTIVCFSQSTATEGQYENLGTVNATSLGGQPVTDDDPSHYFGVLGRIDIEKFTNGVNADEPPGPYITPGDLVTWTYRVENTGNSTLTNVAVRDLNLGVGAVTCPLTELEPGEFTICNAPPGQAEEGQYTNLAFARGLTPLGDPVRDVDPSHYFGAAPGVSIEKDTNGVDADTPPEGPFIPVGDPVRWTYLITNTGNEVLEDIQVEDDQGVTISCPGTTLAVGAEMRCTATGTARRGQYANLGTVNATGVPPGSVGILQPVFDDDPSHYFGAVSRVRIKKFTNGSDAQRPTGPLIPPGDPVTWTYRVSNPGNVLIKSLRVTDSERRRPRFVSGDADGDRDLDPGEVWLYEGTGTAREGQYRNVGSVNGLDVLERRVSDDDPSHYLGTTCIDEPGPPSLLVDAKRHQSLPRRGIPAGIRSDECVRIRTELHPTRRFIRQADLPELVGTARARLEEGGGIRLTTPFFSRLRAQINSLDLLCLWLDVYATDAAGNRAHVRQFIVLRR